MCSQWRAPSEAPHAEKWPAQDRDRVGHVVAEEGLAVLKCPKRQVGIYC